MSILASLARAYDRLPDKPPYGFSTEKIGFAISLSEDGSATVIDLRGDDRKRLPRMMTVPQAVKRTVGIAPNFLWDKTAYVLGLTAGEGKRTAQEHQAFKDLHADWLAGTDDAGLLAVLRFLKGWTPDQTLPGWTEDLRDQNAVFAFEADRRSGLWMHDRPAARDLWRRLSASATTDGQICLVNGEMAPVARLHPSIKGVWGAQSSGAALVSFNLDAFTSYGHEQGDNAPVSEAAAFAYTTALNRFLEKDSGHRIQIGDASTVFWADTSDAKWAAESEGLFAQYVNPDPQGEDADATKEIGIKLAQIRAGKPLAEVTPDLAEGVRFHVLGLAPNAARLSVRFMWESSFGELTANYQRHLSDMRIEPPPRDGFPPLWRYLTELAVLGKRENVPPKLAGDWMRAILSGTPYPLTLLSTTLMRLRADGDVNALRAGILKSVLIRTLKMEVPVALDPTARNKGYVLGRLFAIYEEIQRAALGDNVNATIKDKFYGAASATPQKVFHLLDRGSANHFAKLRKQSPGRAVNLEKVLTSITELMDPSCDPIPSSLSAAEQSLFGIGYYHQRSDFFRKRDEQVETMEISQ
ncbi:type I-C CRISPR-associated protein Cas8c/Csd1 [Frigidibacter sp. RF13]|uniref:type I-C CRISPR-associated protein Cas8c/Csd1 n=1 Tax=Frigidibacter sp. RF13 TaxID=2997340 RepID=UPI0022700A8D|nr:type I-C CRISPR-associated protein Cas8c/Csd1 [Frigidibacter sp. RF13]MCY1128618.1 type I-C CRISPR-associated protein Cas8c/Csd1 [Frigidibacter sp. RF13]